MANGWLIRRSNEVEGRVYWHKEQGWVRREDATVWQDPSDLPPAWRVDDDWVWEPFSYAETLQRYALEQVRPHLASLDAEKQHSYALLCQLEMRTGQLTQLRRTAAALCAYPPWRMEAVQQSDGIHRLTSCLFCGGVMLDHPADDSIHAPGCPRQALVKLLHEFRLVLDRPSLDSSSLPCQPAPGPEEPAP